MRRLHLCFFPILVFLFHLFSICPVASAQNPQGDPLDQQVYWILNNKCVKCHDNLGQDAASGVADLLDLKALAFNYLDASNEEMLNDLLLGEQARMPKPNFDDIRWNGPLTVAEKDVFRDWINRGGVSQEYESQQVQTERSLIPLSSIVNAVASDLASLSGIELQNARYLTLTNLHNHPGVTSQELQIYRAAIVKTLNSLSRSSQILGLDTSHAVNKLTAVDQERTIFRFDLRDIGWTSQMWDRLTKHYPFAIEFNNGSSSAVYSLTSSDLPYLRADWFVFATLQPPFYHELVGIPATLHELESSLGIDRFSEIRNRNVARSGMIESRVSDYNRLLERIPFRGGAYHLSYDNGSNDGESNFIDFPHGPKGLGLASQFEFKHDGGEAIYNLPNGFQAYMLVNSEGQRLDVAPSAIVQDETMPREAIINGISCLSCHFQGMKPEKYSPRLAQLDVVRSAVEENVVRFDARQREIINELFPTHDDFQNLIEQDRQRFLSALETAGIPQQGATEPARELFNRFKDDLDAPGLASEFGLSAQEFRDRMSRETETRQLLKVAEQGIFDRQRLISQFARMSRLLGFEEPRPFVVLPFPYFAEDTTNFAINEAAQANANLTIGHTNVNLIDAENRDGSLKVELWVENERQTFLVGDQLVVRLRANQDGFLTLISVDSTGELILLVPNAFHGNLELKKHQTVTIPTSQMNFEFIAKPPVGTTIVKAIVTTRPLVLENVTAQRLQQEGMPSLGRVKGFHVQQKTNSSPMTPVTELTSQKIETLFAPNEWGTASLSLTIRH